MVNKMNGQERRGASRRETCMAGHLTFGDGARVIDCLVKNLSDTGAGLKTEFWIVCPDLITLRIIDGPIHRCQVIRQCQREMGLKFMGSA